MKIKKNEITVLLIIMLLVGLLMVMINPRSFLTINNLQSMAFQLPELGILSLAMMIVMLTGGSTSPSSPRRICQGSPQP